MRTESVEAYEKITKEVCSGGILQFGKDSKEEVATDSDLVGWTPRGESFYLPKTTDVATQLLNPKHGRDAFTWITIATASVAFLLQISGFASRRTLLIYCLFWRLMYNAGLGWLLYKQSSSNWLVEKADKLGLGKLKEGQKMSWLAMFLVKQIKLGIVEETKGRSDYNSTPIEYNVWILMRHLINFILVNDFTSYIAFALSYFELPENKVTSFDIFRYIAGTLLVMINLWVKTDAHRVLKDYAWYWGDFFFRIESNLNFDGVLGLAPHPMYSIGYVGLYGMSLITKSYYVLVVSIIIHLSQLLFLTIVETPHMRKVYGPEGNKMDAKSRKTLNDYFDNNSLNIWMPDINNEISLLCCFLYLQTFILSSVISRPADTGSIVSLLVLMGQATFWLTLRTFGTGYVLYKQSRFNFWVNFFSQRGKTEVEAFRYWRILYDIIHNQSYITFFMCCWKLMDFSQVYASKTFISRLVIGVTLCLLQVWSTKSALDEIWISGWYYGDFFISKLRLSDEPVYTGIYRYVDNPLMYLTSLWGISLIVNSYYVYFLVAYAQIGLWLITQYVEKPHMRKIYGNSLRNIPGAQRVLLNEISKVQVYTKEKTLKTVASAIEVTSPIMSKAPFGLRPRRSNSVEASRH